MIIDIHEKYDVSPEWFEEQVRDALEIASPDIVERLVLPRLCTLLSVYRVKDENGAREAAGRMKNLINSSSINGAIE